MVSIICNKCGKKLKENHGIIHEDFIKVCKPWGYFSKKDGKTQEFVVCEECMERFVQEFSIPVTEYDTTELI